MRPTDPKSPPATSTRAAASPIEGRTPDNTPGVAAIVPAGNFPVAVPFWHPIPALTRGNDGRLSGVWVLDQLTRRRSINRDHAGKPQKARMGVADPDFAVGEGPAWRS